MSDLDDLDAAFDRACSLDLNPPAGEYVVSAKSVEATKSDRTGAVGLRVRFLIEEGAYAGRALFDTFWLHGGAGPISVQNLETIGFDRLKPREILRFRDFHHLPRVVVRVEQVKRESRTYLEIRSYRPRGPRQDPVGTQEVPS